MHNREKEQVIWAEESRCHEKVENAVSIFNRLAVRYMEKYMYLDLYNDTFDIFCNALEQQNAQILELACGPGNITQYLLKQRPDFKILATDLAPNMLKLAARNNPAATFQIMDCRDMMLLGKNSMAWLPVSAFHTWTKKRLWNW